MVFAAKSDDIFDIIDVIDNGWGMSFAAVPSSDSFAHVIRDWSKYASEPRMPCGLTIWPKAHTPAEVTEEATRLPPPAQRQHGDTSSPHAALALPADVHWLTTRWPHLPAAINSVFTKAGLPPAAAMAVSLASPAYNGLQFCNPALLVLVPVSSVDEVVRATAFSRTVTLGPVAQLLVGPGGRHTQFGDKVDISLLHIGEIVRIAADTKTTVLQVLAQRPDLAGDKPDQVREEKYARPGKRPGALTPRARATGRACYTCTSTQATKRCLLLLGKRLAHTTHTF